MIDIGKLSALFQVVFPQQTSSGLKNTSQIASIVQVSDFYINVKGM